MSKPIPVDWVEELNRKARILSKHIAIADAARDLLSAIYGMGPPGEIQTYSCYDEIEDLELALTALHDGD